MGNVHISNGQAATVTQIRIFWLLTMWMRKKLSGLEVAVHLW